MTKVSIKGNKWIVDGIPTYSDIKYQGKAVMYKGFAEHFRIVAICRCWGITPENKGQKKS